MYYNSIEEYGKYLEGKIEHKYVIYDILSLVEKITDEDAKNNMVELRKENLKQLFAENYIPQHSDRDYIDILKKIDNFRYEKTNSTSGYNDYWHIYEGFTIETQHIYANCVIEMLDKIIDIVGNKQK